MSEVCFIYLIGPSTGPQKIGHSMLPAIRMKQFQAKHDGPLFLLGQWPVGKRIGLAVERYIHWQLRDRLFRGEWFNVTQDEAVAAIEAGIRAAKSLSPREVIPPVDPGARPSFAERLVTRFPAGTTDAIDRLREEGEDRSDMIREAIDREVKRRRSAKRKGPNPAAVLK